MKVYSSASVFLDEYGVMPVTPAYDLKSIVLLAALNFRLALYGSVWPYPPLIAASPASIAPLPGPPDIAPPEDSPCLAPCPETSIASANANIAAAVILFMLSNGFSILYDADINQQHDIHHQGVDNRRNGDSSVIEDKGAACNGNGLCRILHSHFNYDCPPLSGP